MLTVQTLIGDLGLELVAGEERGEAPIRWVHITELADPTPWLSGGELLLTTGMLLSNADEQRQFVRRLSEHHLAGLGFGIGFNHAELPTALVKEAARLEFPVFAVPYEMPFIAITEKAFGQLVNEQYDTLQRAIGIHKRLEQLVVDERGLEEVARALSASIGGSVCVIDRQGAVVALTKFRRELPQDALDAVGAQVAERSESERPAAFTPDHPALSGRALALPVAGAEGTLAWLVAVRDSGGLADFELLILQQAVTVVALELMRRRVVRETERRLAGDVLEEALSGSADERELEGRLRPFGVGHEAAVMLFGLEDAPGAQAVLDGVINDAGARALVAARDGVLCAVVDTSGGGADPEALAGRARKALANRFGDATASVSRPAPVSALRRSFHEARFALEVSGIANGDFPPVASYRDIGAFQFLLSVQDDEALEAYCDSVLGPIENGEGEYGGELLRSLEAFLEENGHWERAARQLHCHRHTLRYRIRKIEELTGRDLGRARDRIEFWLALRARELLGGKS